MIQSNDTFKQYFSAPSPSQEAQRIFKARYGLDPEPIKTKLIGFGMQLLEGIDPNPENYVTAGIIHTRNQQIGCLVRLEPNKQAMVSLASIFVCVMTND